MRNIILICAAILLVGGSFVFAEYRNNGQKVVYTAPEIEGGSNLPSSDIDTDSDGVRDWEEILVGTDPNNSKSNVKNQSSAVLSGQIDKDLTKISAKLDPIEATSREFFARYMELRQLGLSEDKLNQEDLVNKTVGSIEIRQPAMYKMEEIVINEDSGVDSVKRYGENLKKIFDTYLTSTRNEASIAKEATEREDPELLKEIDPIIASYKKIINGLLAIPAPKSMATMHLDLLNSLNAGLFNASAFRKSDVDPVTALSAAGQYLEVEKELRNALNAINSYFTYLGIYEKPF